MAYTTILKDAAGEDIERAEADFRADRPLRMEIEAIERILANIEIGASTCLDLGFTNPAGGLSLRRAGGYWTTVAWTQEQARAAKALTDEEPLLAGSGGELPFEDKQFDVVVMPRGHLSADPVRDEALIQECHRVLRTPGYLIMSGDYRKRFNIAGLLCRNANGDTGGGYDEKQIFDLLKTGFDVLGVKTYCRFWVQLVRDALDMPGRGKGPSMRALYWLAYQLDALLFFTKGYQVIAYGRRKGWRERQPLGVRNGQSIGEAVLRRSRT